MLFKALQAEKADKQPVKVDELPRTVKQVTQLIEELKILNYEVTQQDIEAFCLSIMGDKSASHKDRLQAARLLAQVKGYLEKDKQTKGVNGARIKWAMPIETTATKDSLT